MYTRQRLGADYQEPVRDSSKVRTGELNEEISKTLDFMSDKYEDPMSGPTIFHNKRRVVTNTKDETKKKIS
jgi:hypothetical protein